MCEERPFAAEAKNPVGTENAEAEADAAAGVAVNANLGVARVAAQYTIY